LAAGGLVQNCSSFGPPWFPKESLYQSEPGTGDLFSKLRMSTQVLAKEIEPLVLTSPEIRPVPARRARGRVSAIGLEVG